MTDETAGGKLDDAEHQTQDGDDAHKQQRGVGMHDVAHRSASHKHQRTAPEIETQILDTYQPTVETMTGVLYHKRQDHRNYQYNTYLVQNTKKSREKGEMLTLLYQRKTDWYQDSSYKI